jgi:hypothetical protein
MFWTVNHTEERSPVIKDRRLCLPATSPNITGKRKIDALPESEPK